MAISSLTDYAAALKQTVLFQKNGVSAASLYSSWAQPGSFTAGSLSIGNTANGLVPTASTTGAVPINSFSGTGYATYIQIHNAGIASRIWLVDRLFHCGSYTSNSGTTTLSTQPSYSARVPGGTNFVGTQIWVESASNTTPNTTGTITYTDQSGNTGHSTPAVAMTTLNSAGRITHFPLAAGDCGVQKIESVNFTAASDVNGLNVIVVRPIKFIRIPNSYTASTYPLEVCHNEVYSTSCFQLIHANDNTATNVYDVRLEIASA